MMREKMNQTSLRSLIRNLVLEAFSVGTIKKRTEDFQSEDPTVTPEEARYYLDRFSDVQNSPHVQDKDIQRYSWRNRTSSDGNTTTGLKDFIDSKWSTRAFYEPVAAGDLEPIYESENGSLQVFLGDKREKCVTFRKNFEGRTGQSYNWCISRSDSSNMFTNYRFRQDEPVFYYIFDFERKTSDPLHACVIYVTSDGKYWLSDAKNTGDKEYSWGSLVGMMPKIKDLKSTFRHIPTSQREKDTHKETSVLLNDKQFSELTRDQKEYYISAGHKLSDGQIRNLWSLPDRVDLVNKYCNHNRNVFIPLDIWKKLPGATKKVVQDNFEKRDEIQTLYQVHYLGVNKIKGNLSTFGIGVVNGTPKLPEELEVEGNLNLMGLNMELPSNLKVGGIIFLRHPEISELPPNIKCSGISVNRTNISNIDSNIFWNKAEVPYLGVSDTRITELPGDLHFIDELFMNRTKIKSLPPTLRVNDLNAESSELNSLPEGFVVRNAQLYECKDLKELPQNMIVSGNLDITFCPIDNLPQGLQVGGDISLSKNTKITSLPLDLKLGGKIEIPGGKISEFPFYKDYLKIKRLNKPKQKSQTSIGESLTLLKRVIRESLRDLD
jgi:hypothetical protein